MSRPGEYDVDALAAQPDVAAASHRLGGGGFGDPLRRVPEKVATDVAQGLVSENEAQRLYGVILWEDGTIDKDSTVETRTELRQKRQKRQSVEDTDPKRVREACTTCSATNGFATSRYPLRRAGPWIARRYDGDGPNFELQEIVCRACGALLEVTEVLR